MEIFERIHFYLRGAVCWLRAVRPRLTEILDKQVHMVRATAWTRYFSSLTIDSGVVLATISAAVSRFLFIK